MSLMTSKEYFSPDPNLSGPLPCLQFLQDPLPSLTSRIISLHSAISVHGYTFIDGRQVWYESILERCCALIGRLRPDVIHVAEQPPAVRFVDDEGHERHHFFDFQFTFVNAERTLTAVKPLELVEETGIDRIVELVAEQISPSAANFVDLFTEEKLSEVDLFNAEVVNLATRDPSPENDAVLAKCIRKLKGEIEIGKLVDMSGLGGFGYDAVVRAIDTRLLRLEEYQKLDFDAVVSRTTKRKG